MIEFDVQRRQRGIFVKVAPEFVADLIILLDTISGLLREVKVKAAAAESERKSRLVGARKKRAHEFAREALEVLDRYEKYLDDAYTHQEARIECKEDFNLSTLSEVDILLVHGRQLTKKTGKRHRADRAEAENHFIELKEAA
jgi:hypothetical protein